MARGASGEAGRYFQGRLGSPPTLWQVLCCAGDCHHINRAGFAGAGDAGLGIDKQRHAQFPGQVQGLEKLHKLADGFIIMRFGRHREGGFPAQGFI